MGSLAILLIPSRSRTLRKGAPSLPNKKSDSFMILAANQYIAITLGLYQRFTLAYQKQISVLTLLLYNYTLLISKTDFVSMKNGISIMNESHLNSDGIRLLKDIEKQKKMLEEIFQLITSLQQLSSCLEQIFLKSGANNPLINKAFDLLDKEQVDFNNDKVEFRLFKSINNPAFLEFISYLWHKMCLAYYQAY